MGKTQQRFVSFILFLRICFDRRVGWQYHVRRNCIPIAWIYFVLICYYYYSNTFFIHQVVIIVYAFCAGEFFVRYLWKRPFRSTESSKSDGDAAESKSDLNGRGEMTFKMQLMVVALCFSTLCLLIRWVQLEMIQCQCLIMNLLFTRAVYRTIELADGWDGRIISTQVLFSTSP